MNLTARLVRRERCSMHSGVIRTKDRRAREQGDSLFASVDDIAVHRQLSNMHQNMKLTRQWFSQSGRDPFLRRTMSRCSMHSTAATRSHLECRFRSEARPARQARGTP